MDSLRHSSARGSDSGIHATSAPMTAARTRTATAHRHLRTGAVVVMRGLPPSSWGVHPLLPGHTVHLDCLASGATEARLVILLQAQQATKEGASIRQDGSVQLAVGRFVVERDSCVSEGPDAGEAPVLHQLATG